MRLYLFWGKAELPKKEGSTHGNKRRRRRVVRWHDWVSCGDALFCKICLQAPPANASGENLPVDGCKPTPPKLARVLRDPKEHKLALARVDLEPGDDTSFITDNSLLQHLWSLCH